MFPNRLGLVLGILAVVGCGNDGKQRLAPLTGTVTYKGKPVVGAHMTFIPDDTSLRPAIATTDANGRYSMETYEPKDGAGVGRGKLGISLRGPAKKMPPGAGEAVLEMLADVGDPLIPIKYFNPDKSGLTFEVKPGITNVFDIDLTD